MKGRSVASSETFMTHRALPGDTNAAGNVHGGVILKHIDLAGAVCAMRHARGCSVVTASIDRMEFKAPVHVGELMMLKSSLNFVGSKSMEVGVRVESEDLFTGKIRHVASAYLTFVAMNAEKKATTIPPLVVESHTQERRLQEARLRRAARQAERQREQQTQEEMEQSSVYSPEELY